jgi:hypothetical protein
VLPKEELDNNEAKLENSAHKSLTQLAWQLCSGDNNVKRN